MTNAVNPIIVGIIIVHFPRAPSFRIRIDPTDVPRARAPTTYRVPALLPYDSWSGSAPLGISAVHSSPFTTAQEEKKMKFTAYKRPIINEIIKRTFAGIDLMFSSIVCTALIST